MYNGAEVPHDACFADNGASWGAPRGGIKPPRPPWLHVTYTMQRPGKIIAYGDSATVFIKFYAADLSDYVIGTDMLPVNHALAKTRELILSKHQCMPPHRHL